MNEAVNELSQEDVNKRLKEHLLYTRGDKGSKSGFFGNSIIKNINFGGKIITGSDFSNSSFENVDFSESEIMRCNFSNCTFTKVNFSFSQLIGSNFTGSIFKDSSISIRQIDFEDANLTECKFNYCQGNNISFKKAITRGTCFIGFDISDKLNISQIKESIFTEEDYNKYIEVKNKDKKIEEITSRNIELKNKVSEVSDERTEELKQGFKEIRDHFIVEERMWLLISIIGFLILFFVVSIPLIELINYKYLTHILFFFYLFVLFLPISIGYEISNAVKSNKDNLEWWGKIWEFIKLFIKTIFGLIIAIVISMGIYYGYYKNIEVLSQKVFNFNNPLYYFIPTIVTVSTFIYFSVFQYSKAKNLRIENQNKLAILSGYKAILAENNLDEKLKYFLPNISDVIFTKITSSKKEDNNLPYDEIIRLIDLIKK